MMADFNRMSDGELEARMELIKGLSQLLGYPACPAEPGLYALMAPDDVMVRVVDGSLSSAQLRDFILHDAAGRMVRDERHECQLAGMTEEETCRRLMPKVLDFKSRYRLERLA
jgi:hypothetical protein